MNNSTLKALLIEYEKKRINAENIAQKEKEKLYAEFPELANIDKKLSSLAFTSMRELAKNNDKKIIDDLNFNIENLKKQKESILNSIGEKAKKIIPNYECKKCNDTGYIFNGSSTEMCSCLKQKLYNIEYNKSNIFNLENDKMYIRDNTIISIFLNCGLRVSELVSLNISSINIKNKSIMEFGKERIERNVPLNKNVENKNIIVEKDDKKLAKKYEEIMEKLKRALNSSGWDGRWFRRAFMDDGNVLGSMQNEECRIDSIAQSWSVISEAGDNDKKYISMESLENHLIDKENGVIKLLDPPFDKGILKPGYISSYVPGTRENGGQYTHVCCC